MEALRVVLLSIAGLVFIVLNYQRRQGNFKKRVDDKIKSREVEITQDEDNHSEQEQ